MIKPCKLNESVVAITNTSCIYLLTCVWVFCFLKVQQFNLSLTLAVNYTKATLIYPYFTNQVSILLISAEIKAEKSLFFQVNLLLKQPFADVFQRRCSKDLRNIHRKIPALESLFNKVPVIQTCYFKSNSNEGVLLWLLQNL